MTHWAFVLMTTIFKAELFQDFLDILFPMSCLGCGANLQSRQEIAFCSACLPEVRLLQEPLCTVCGKPFGSAAGENHHCSDCLGKNWHFRQARAVVRYQPPVTEAVRMFKYRAGMYGLASFAALGQQYFACQPLEEFDLIVPVPLHIKRLRQRGFNQALVLCRKLFPRDRKKIDPHILERHHWVRPQAGLSGKERRRNVRNAFRVSLSERLKHKKVLLVDDVFTTGATVDECARVLCGSEAAAVDVFTFARVVN